ncbi:AfsR/SARP family transcriptional regulator [Phytohabitans kaempferiae]|uniref:BTAD domain-containing putative transcriptional regulator n=1 Tax=Phytohabitans kaempferiae TaxID=1620943 RepID=A0ABV6M2U5_9ACTN
MRRVWTVGLVAWLVGPPAVLLWWQGWPLPDSWSGLGQWPRRLLAGEADAAAVAGWIVWVLLTYAAMVHFGGWVRDAARALRSVTGLVVLLVGMPAGLLWWAGMPSRWPTDQEVRQWVAEPLTWSTIVAGTAIIGWLFWLALVYAVAAEVVSRLGSKARWLPPLSLPSPLRALAGGVLGAAAVTATTSAGHSAAPAADVAVVAALEETPGTAMPAASPSAGQTTAPAGEERGSHGVEVGGGVTLPDGGWLPAPVADAVAGAATWVWSRRRRLYLPGVLEESSRSDPDLLSRPDSVLAIQTARQQPSPSTRNTGGDDSLPTRPIPAADLGERTGPPLLARDLPAGGVGLTGAGAHDAARGILAAQLLPGKAGTRVITTAPDLQLLLGSPTIQQFARTPGLDIADDLEGAIGLLEQALLETGVQSSGASTQQAPAEPVTFLATAPTDVGLARRLAVLLGLGHQRGAAGVLLGEWTIAATWHVDETGRTQPTQDTASRRLCVLTAAAATDLLALYRAVAEEPDPSGPAPARRASPDAVPSATAAVRAAAPTADGGPADAGSRQVQITVLGAPVVHCGGMPVAIRRTAGTQILVFLAIHAGGATSAQITAAIWPHLRAHTAAGSLHTAVSELRRTLDDAGGGRDVIQRVNGRYQLDTAHVDVDLWRLRTLVRAATKARGPADREPALWGIVETFTGELAAGWDWPWLTAHREATRRDVLDAYTELVAAHPDQAASLLSAAVRVDPINEHLHQRAVAALRAAGDHAAANALAVHHARHLAAAGLQTSPIAYPVRSAQPA